MGITYRYQVIHHKQEPPMDVTGKYTPIQLYEKGIYTLDEIIEMVPDLDPEWVAEQERLIEENHKKYALQQEYWLTGWNEEFAKAEREAEEKAFWEGL
jgi:hypothetical protein